MCWKSVTVLFLVISLVEIKSMSTNEKRKCRDKSLEMFHHAYDSYMANAYPADELMPLSCRGRVRGVSPGRGDVDDALGSYSLTLIDTLDTLAVIGEIDEFSSAIQRVIKDVRLDADLVISVFETSIRVLGGLLGAHFAADWLKNQGDQRLAWYNGELVSLAEEVGMRLLPAFDTSTGIPYPRINLRHGLDKGLRLQDVTCTACAGTHLLEFAALSRLTGNHTYEMKARNAMEAIWNYRESKNDLVGTTINVHSGQWNRKDSGVGAGIDSYYEYCLKAYVLLGDQTYLRRFSKHYDAVKRFVSLGPMLVDVNMNTQRTTKTFMDSLLAFWPGLQVLWGDLDPAIATHEMLYYVTHRHKFIPEAFTTDFRVHWAHHLLRPEFIESTYFLYKATGDPYYLDVGKSIMDSLERYARVQCGYAALKDVTTGGHEDRMDSFVLAETFKYLYLMYAEEEDILLPINEFIFTTEAHLIPLNISTLNISFNNNEEVSFDQDDGRTDDDISEDISDDDDTIDEILVPLTCEKADTERWSYDYYRRLMLQQCGSLRYGLLRSSRPRKGKDSMQEWKRSVTTSILDFTNDLHIKELSEMGISIKNIGNGQIQLFQSPQNAICGAAAQEGLLLMQEIMRSSVSQGAHRSLKELVILSPEEHAQTFTAGPAQFGPDFGINNFVSGRLVVGSPLDGCTALENVDVIERNIVLLTRGNCMFIEKVRNAEEAGATAAVIYDNKELPENMSQPLSMSGNGSDDVIIPSVFVTHANGKLLTELLEKETRVLIRLQEMEITSTDEEDSSEEQDKLNEPEISNKPSATCRKP